MEYKDMTFQYVRYQFTDLQLIAGDNDPFPVPDSMIASVYLEKDYDNTYFPYFEIDLNLPYWVYANMVANTQNCYLSLSMKYGFFEREIKSATVPMISELSDKFYCVFSDMSPTIEDENLRKLEKQNETLNQRYAYGDQMLVQMLLFRDNYFKGFRKQVNAVLSSSTLTNALTYVINKAGMNKFLMSPPDNRKNFREFRITPIDAIHQMNRICNDYAIHNTGTIIFLDLDRGYILSKKPDCDAYADNEWQTTNLVCLEVYNHESTKAGGQFKNSKEKNNVIRIIGDTITAYDQTNQKKTSFQVIDTTTGTVTKHAAGDGGSSQTTYTYSSGDNAGESVATRIKESGKELLCLLRNCTLEALTPNKCMVVTIDNTKMKQFSGKYRVAKMSCTFEKEGIYYNPVVVLELKGQ